MQSNTAYNELRARPVATWSEEDVLELLVHLELVHLQAAFRKRCLNGATLQQYSKKQLEDDLGCTEIEAIMIVDALRTPSRPTPVASSYVPPPSQPVPVAYPYAPPPVAVYTTHYTSAPAPMVIQNGFVYQARERYIGGVTWVIALCFCFPCIFCCPVDERPASVQPALVQVQPATLVPVAQTMRS